MVEYAAMGTRARTILQVVAFATAAALPWLGAAVAEEGPYPVRIVAPWLELTSADAAAIEARFEQPLPPHEGMLPPSEYVKYSHDRRTSKGPYDELVVDRAKPTTCTELMALVDAGYVPWNEPVYLDHCTALRLLRRARPARISYVRDFVMNSEAVDVLPVMVANGALFDRLCEEYIANQQGVPWSVFDKVIEVDAIGRYTMDVSTQRRDGRMEGDNDHVLIGGGQTLVSILAWADFNGDGIEDLLVDSSSHPLTWKVTLGSAFIHSSSFSNVYILTRDAADAVMRVVDAERYLTPDKLDYEPCVYP